MRTEAPLPLLLRARALLGALALLMAGTAAAEPTSVVLVGTVKDALNCPPADMACSDARLVLDTGDNAWQGVFPLHAGTWTFRVAVDDGGTISTYGQGGAVDGTELSLTLDADSDVKFYYDSKTHWVTTRFNSVIATAPGNFQSELGCPGDWQPDCLGTWLKDVDGDGIYTFSTTALPAGTYEGKVAINESWSENYGAGGARDGANIGFSVPSLGTPVVFQYDSVSHKLNIEVIGAPKGDINRARAHWVSDGLLVWEPTVASIPAGASFRLYYDPNGAMIQDVTGISGGQSILLTREVTLPPQIAEKFPHLVGKPVLRIADEDLILVPTLLKGQLALSLADVDGNLMDATSVQLPGVLDALYANDEALGLTWTGDVPTLKLWAPTARNVNLHLFESSTTSSVGVIPMQLDPATGVWSFTGDATWKGLFYLYEVEVYVRSERKVVKNLVTDPYSLSLSTNSTRSQFVDLADAGARSPRAGPSLVKPALAAPEDIVIYELHVRDFSVNDPTVPESEARHLHGLHRAGLERHEAPAATGRRGLTHVHLLPVFDIATIDEDRSKHWQAPARRPGRACPPTRTSSRPR